MDIAPEASIFNRPAFLTASKHLFFASPIRQILKLSTKLHTTPILRCNSRASINCSLFNSRFSGKEVFVNGVRLSSVIVKCSGAKAQNGGYKLGILEVLVKKGLILAAIVCGVEVFRCRRVTAVEGFLSAGGVEVLEQSGLLLRSWWPKVLQVLRVFKDQGLLLVVLFALSAFFSTAETAITTLWPWKILCQYGIYFESFASGRYTWLLF